MKIKNFWMKLDGGLAPDDPSGPLLLARQLHAYFSVVPVAVGGNIFNAFVVAIFAYGAVPHPLLAAWVALIAGISLIRLRSWRNHVNQPGVRNPHQTLFHITTISLITGSAWGAAVAWMLVFTPSSIFVPTMVAAGMMNAGASMLNAVPKAAIAFIAPIALGASCGLATMDATNGFTAAALLLAYCVVLGRSIDAAFSNLVSRTLHEYQLVEQATRSNCFCMIIRSTVPTGYGLSTPGAASTMFPSDSRRRRNVRRRRWREAICLICSTIARKWKF